MRWYWLKSELVDFCRSESIPYTGLKSELTDRVRSYLAGEEITPLRPAPPTSDFQWSRETITPQTIITDSYRNGPNVRKFFIEHIGKKFRFNIQFMKWMKENCGKTMGDAVEAWNDIEAERKAGKKTKIPKGNQYNQYLRDFFEANPDRTIMEARKCWREKMKNPGKFVYQHSDLKFLKKSG